MDAACLYHTHHTQSSHVQITLGALWPESAQMSDTQMLSLPHSCHTAETEHTPDLHTAWTTPGGPDKLPSKSRPWDNRHKSHPWPALHHLQSICPSCICGAYMYCSHDVHHECIPLLMHTRVHIHTHTCTQAHQKQPAEHLEVGR